MKIPEGTNLLVKGPCKILIESGLIDIFGKDFHGNDIVEIPSGKVYPIKILIETELKFIGECQKTRVKELFTESWLKAIEIVRERVREKKPLKVLVLGFCDVGKSSFTITLANTLFDDGIKVGIVDSDIGQAKIGIPGIISGAILDKKRVSMDELLPTTFYFIGDNTPAGHLLQVLIGVDKVTMELIKIGAEIVIIDTTGMVFGGPARALKMGKISLMNPDLVITIERENELYHLKSLIPKDKLIEVKSPPKIKKIPREIRINRRREKIIEFFKEHEKMALKLDDLKFEYVFLKTGMPIQNPNLIFGEDVIYAELSPDVFLLVVRNMRNRREILENARRFIVTVKTVYLAKKLGMDVSERIRTSPLLTHLNEESVLYLGSIIAERKPDEISIQIIKDNYYNGLLVGLSDDNDEFIGVGIIKEINFEEGYINIIARKLKEGRISKVWIGCLRYNDEFYEIEKRKIGLG